MIDIHHHLLWGLDDGPSDFETSLAMARMAAEDGITHLVATPHSNHRYAFDPEANAEKLNKLRQALRDESIAMQLGQGCDFHLSYENLQDAAKHPTRYTINGGPYLLIELPDFSIPTQLEESFYELRLAGITPLLTHPERNPVLQKKDERMKEWLRHGMLVQVTTSSVLGQMGSVAEKMAHRMLANRWVHFLATDAHNTKHRPPRMREAYEVVANKYGKAYAERICVENPLAVFEGRPLGPQEELLKLFDDEPRSWLGRLFGR